MKDKYFIFRFILKIVRNELKSIQSNQVHTLFTNTMQMPYYNNIHSCSQFTHIYNLIVFYETSKRHLFFNDVRILVNYKISNLKKHNLSVLHLILSAGMDADRMLKPLFWHKPFVMTLPHFETHFWCQLKLKRLLFSRGFPNQTILTSDQLRYLKIDIKRGGCNSSIYTN